MNITNLPLHDMVGEDNKITAPWRIFFNQLVNQLQAFLGDEKYVLPFQPKSTATSVADLNVRASEGGLLYDNESKTGKINTQDGHTTPATYSFKTIVTYEELTQAQINAIPVGQRNGRIIYETDTGNTKLGSNNTFITL